MNKEIIKHPYQVPENFFEDNEKDLMETFNRNYQKNKVRSLILNVSKYAAIIAVSFLLGRLSVSFFNSGAEEQVFAVETVLSQVSEDEVIEFLIDNITDDVLK
jgi:uncharacterized protein (DUF2164 family)